MLHWYRCSFQHITRSQWGWVNLHCQTLAFLTLVGFHRRYPNNKDLPSMVKEALSLVETPEVSIGKCQQSVNINILN